jgi:hypothetical protein
MGVLTVRRALIHKNNLVIGLGEKGAMRWLVDGI